MKICCYRHYSEPSFKLFESADTKKVIREAGYEISVKTRYVVETHTHTRTHAHTHARTHTRTHARTLSRTHLKPDHCAF